MFLQQMVASGGGGSEPIWGMVHSTDVWVFEQHFILELFLWIHFVTVLATHFFNCFVVCFTILSWAGRINKISGARPTGYHTVLHETVVMLASCLYYLLCVLMKSIRAAMRLGAYILVVRVVCCSGVQWSRGDEGWRSYFIAPYGYGTVRGDTCSPFRCCGGM